MIMNCRTCGLLWQDHTRNDERLAGAFQCRACEADLQPNDRLVCKVTTTPGWFLQRGNMYTIRALVREHDAVYVVLFGNDQDFDLDFFEIVPRSAIDATK